MRAQRLVDLAVGLAPALIAPLEINRAKAELQSLKQTREVAIRDWMVASAALAEILLLDPETLLEPVEPPFSQVTLMPADQTAAELVPVAIANRPEIASQRELLAAANQRLKQEKKRRFCPACTFSAVARPRVCWPPAISPPVRMPDWAPMRQRRTSRLRPSGSFKMSGWAISAASASAGPSKTWRPLK